MKKIILSALLFLSVFIGNSQTKISDMTTTTNPVGAYVPVIRSGSNYKLLVDSIAAGKVDSVRVSNDSLYYYKRGTSYFVYKISTSNAFIQNQISAEQNASAWLRTMKAKRLSIANEDSAHLDWWWKGDNDPSWTYFQGKNLWISDNDTVSAANDNWNYAINTNAVVQRITRLNPSMGANYRFNFLAKQIFTNGDSPASMPLLGGDAGAALYGKLMLKNNAGYTGRTVINGGTPSFNATPATVSLFEVDGFDPAHVNATGYWAGYNSTLVAIHPDTVEHFIHYNNISYTPGFNGNVKTQTGFYIDYTTSPAIQAKWGVYAPDGSGNSYNLLSRLGVGASGFGSHESPSFHSSAQLQINSTDKGFMTSRMSAAQRIAIASPDTAVFVWDIDSARYFGYKPGTGWKGLMWTDEAGSGGGGGGEPSITAPYTAGKYWNGYKEFVSLNTDSLTEGSTNLFYTDARSRSAISLTTTGSGAATYNNTTGVLNIPTPSSSAIDYTFRPFYSIIDECEQSNTTNGFWKSSGGTGSAVTYNSQTEMLSNWVAGNASFKTGTTSSGTAVWSISNGGSSPYTSMNGNKRVNYGTLLYFPAVANSTDDYQFTFGWAYNASGVNLPANVTHGIYFRYDKDDSTGNFIAVCKTGAFITEDATNVTLTAGTEYELEISVFGTSAYFYINDVLVSTITTNIPFNQYLNAIGYMTKTAGTTDVACNVDWIGIGVQRN
jgi:hypothetical protein